MQYNAGAQLDGSQVEVRGGGSGGRVAVGGGVSILVIILGLRVRVQPERDSGQRVDGFGVQPRKRPEPMPDRR